MGGSKLITKKDDIIRKAKDNPDSEVWQALAVLAKAKPSNDGGSKSKDKG